MRVVNVHNRTIFQSKQEVFSLVETLSSKEDQVWPHEKWPRMRLDKGLQVGSKGGHGPIRYAVEQYKAGELIEFEFSKPEGFKGVHRLDVTEIEPNKTKIEHTIDIQISAKSFLLWKILIEPLHDALIEDAFDKVENHFAAEKKISKWSLWVKLGRKILA